MYDKMRAWEIGIPWYILYDDLFFFFGFQSAQALALGLFPPSSPFSGKSQVFDINVMDKDYDDMEPNPL